MAFDVKAQWDAEAQVWVASSEDVPGLVAEAATLEGLVDDLRAIIPDLLELNSVPHPPIVAVKLTASRSEELALAD